jgi:hypothetical protein
MKEHTSIFDAEQNEGVVEHAFLKREKRCSSETVPQSVDKPAHSQIRIYDVAFKSPYSRRHIHGVILAYLPACILTEDLHHMQVVQKAHFSYHTTNREGFSAG